MMTFLSGPALIFSLLVFVVGMLVRIVLYVRGLDWRLERVAYGPQWKRGLPGAVISVLQWMIPAGTSGWRTQPVMMAAFFLFHVGAVLLPLFLLGHVIILEDLIGIRVPALPMTVADGLTLLTIGGLALLAWRRISNAAAAALTTKEDWLILIIAGLPFITGLLARFFPSPTWTMLHLISGQLFLIVAPFTKLSHIVLYFMSRAQIGMDFAIKRGGGTRGPAFPW